LSLADNMIVVLETVDGLVDHTVKIRAYKLLESISGNDHDIERGFLELCLLEYCLFVMRVFIIYRSHMCRFIITIYSYGQRGVYTCRFANITSQARQFKLRICYINAKLN
jgi:hypothetical protein